MIQAIKKLLGIGGPAVDLAQVLAGGGIIVDVRTEGEYAGGHLNRSVNIPLNLLSAQMSKLNKDTPVITCCASGMRSKAAKSALQANGFKEVYNGGSWNTLRKYDR